MKLKGVSQTAIYTLLGRVAQSEKINPIFNDPMAVLCYEKIMSMATDEEKKRYIKVKKFFSGKFASGGNQKAAAHRILYLDQLANDYISSHPACTVINLACGLDTRFWRINHENCKFIELDLPEVIALKKELLKEHITYKQISASVLDADWMKQVTSKGNMNFLLIAEGLFMYLKKQDATKLLHAISQKFNRSQLALDVFDEKYTKGLWQKIFKWSYKQFYGIDVTLEFGIKKPKDIESYAAGFKVIDVKEEGGWYFITASNEKA
jgi:methyltransferase (TIGR00027 family)